jgi:ABC-type sulfate/molybdate transport systems ATPase subunit
MQMRVAFAVATAFDPDILIIDEALAVGDAYFQQKCFHRLEKFKERGGTMLFVSHDANTVKHLCDQAVLLSDGRAISHGVPRDVIDLYQGLVAQKTDMGDREVVVTQKAPAPASWHKATTVTTNDEAELIDFKLLGANAERVTYLESETPLTVQYVVKLHKDFDRPAFGLIVRDRIGRSIFETSTYSMRVAEEPIAAGTQVVVRFLFNFNLRAGQYSFSIGVANRGFARSEFEQYSLLMHDVEQLQVIESSTAAFYGGIFNMNPAVSLEILEESHA